MDNKREPNFDSIHFRNPSILIPIEFYSSSFRNSVENRQKFERLSQDKGILILGIENGNRTFHSFVPLNCMKHLHEFKKELENNGLLKIQLRLFGKALSEKKMTEETTRIEQVVLQQEQREKKHSYSSYTMDDFSFDEIHELAMQSERAFQETKRLNNGKWPFEPFEEENEVNEENDENQEERKQEQEN
jgi:hypothetical protein